MEQLRLWRLRFLWNMILCCSVSGYQPVEDCGALNTLLTNHPTQCHISEDLNPQQQCCENLKSLN